MGQLQAIGLATQTVRQLPADAPHLGELFADVNRQADGAGAVVDGPGHPLANPPVGVGRKLVAHGGVELVDGALQADGPFLHQVEKFQPLVLVLLGHAHHQAQVGRHHSVAGPLGHAELALVLGGELLGRKLEEAFAGLHVVRQFDFLGCREQGHPSDRAQIPADGIGTETSTGPRPSGLRFGC